MPKKFTKENKTMFVQLETNWYVNIYQIRQIRDHPDDDRIVVWIEDNALGKEFSGDDRQRILKAVSLYCPNQEPRS